MRSAATLLFLVSLAFAVLTVVSAQGSGRICPQGGAPPAECAGDDQHQWDSTACKWVCKCRSNEGNWISIGERYKDQCNSCTCGANGASTCTKIGCSGLGVCFDDQGKGYDKDDTMKQSCNTCTCLSNGQWGCTKMACPDMCAQGGAPPAECKEEGQYTWDQNTCKWICKGPVQCIIDPCVNAARDDLCPFELCTADYSTGCNFKCSTKPTRPNICPLGGQVPPHCNATGQAEWDQNTCKWICTKCLSNEGSLVSIGDKYFDQCNSCTCGLNSQGSCTKIGCSGLGVCFDDQGKGYEKDATRKQDCNTCTCQQNGQWACTEIACDTRVCRQGGKPPAECPTTNVWDNKACTFVCQPPPSTCLRKCATTKCPEYTVCEQDQKCKVKCTVVILPAKFTVTMNKLTNTVTGVETFITGIAKNAGDDVAAALMILDILKMGGNSFNYKWTVKIGIKAVSDIERQSLLQRFVDEAKKTKKVATTNNINAADDATDVDAGTIDSEYDITTEEPMMAMQSCPDGSQISAADECPIDTLAVPATSSSSSSSTPIVAIIVPIVAGVVLIAVIATAVVILRRRANTIKSINNVQQDTQMAQRV